ncbi:hypothetical protein JXQ31_04060 [candidate division KSB1 bacterium]|nr:hypothetical protein [candidate division KSB1 bacterium]
MTDRELFCRDLLKHGASVSIVRETGGTICPCTTETGEYSPEWHRNNPAEPDCGGLGRLNTLTTTIPAKAFVFNYMLLKNFKRLEPIGTIYHKDLMMIGTAKEDDATFIDLSDMDEKLDFVLYQSEKYKVRQTDQLASNDTVAQFFILRRINEYT